MEYKLVDLINVEKTQELLESFFAATQIPAAIIDLQGVVLVTSRWRRICTDFHRVDEITCKRCIESDTVLANDLLQGKRFSLYRCLNGLMDAASPIIIEGEHLANAFIGQFFISEPDADFFRKQAAEYGFDEAAYLDALSEIPVVAEESLRAILTFLTSFAEMIASLGLKSLRQLEVERELRRARGDLELHVRERTSELSHANANLQREIAERKLIEHEIHAQNSLLRLMADAADRKDYLTGVVELVKEWSGCRCVGIRVLDSEGNMPYGAYTGFDRAFLEKENWLCIARDACICTRVIAQDPEPQDACCMSEKGSFFLNDSRKFLESLDEEERKRFRGICIQSGFRSFAVVPIRESGKVVGAVHLADERAGMAPEPQIRFLEGISGFIGEGIIKFNSKDALKRANRALRVLSESNYALSQELEEKELLTRVCRIVVEVGGYKLAWVGYAEQDEGKRVRPVARWGYGVDYLDSIRISWADTELGRGPTGRAIREGKLQTGRNFMTEPQLSPWTYEALKYGIHSSAAFPLVIRGKVFGALSIYSSDADAFHEDEEEVRLLSTLAGNLAYGIKAIRTHKEHERAEGELRVYTRKLQESNQALEEFASIASHDMREPLRKIISFGKRLQSDRHGSLDSTGKDYLERMIRAANRMQVLLNALLEYSRVATKAEPFIPVDLTALIHEVLEDLEVRILETGGKVELGKLPTIEAAPHQMRQLFQNFIGNALKYHGEEKPVVRIHGEPLEKEGMWHIEVSDNGIGFEQTYAERIFAPFQRLHGRDEFEGVGMGLAICKKIVERHGGTIAVRSAPGKGSTFTVTLPVVQPKLS